MIHDRDAHDDVLRVLREEGAPDTVVFHCFSGDAAMARDVRRRRVRALVRRPGHASATPRELREAAALVPDDQLLVETDAPFLTPHPHRGRANEPYCLPWTVRGLADVRGVSDERLATAPGVTPSGCSGSVSCRRPPTRRRRAPRTRVRRSDPPFGDHGVSRPRRICHRPLRFRDR